MLVALRRQSNVRKSPISTHTQSRYFRTASIFRVRWGLPWKPWY